MEWVSYMFFYKFDLSKSLSSFESGCVWYAWIPCCPVPESSKVCVDGSPRRCQILDGCEVVSSSPSYLFLVLLPLYYTIAILVQGCWANLKGYLSVLSAMYIFSHGHRGIRILLFLKSNL